MENPLRIARADGAAGAVEMPALIVPDIHNRVDDAEAFIAKHGGDCRSIVFLGDYFDSYDGGPMEAHFTARWLKRSLATPGRFHLLGNHDASYFSTGTRRPFAQDGRRKTRRSSKRCGGIVFQVAPSTWRSKWGRG
jgi:hypothetical protein